MSDKMPAAWSNGQWIQLDLANNRYKGSEIERNASMQTRQAAAVASLRTSSCEMPRFMPSVRILAHYLRCAWTAHRVRYLPIRDQLTAIRNARSPRKQPSGDIAEFAWYYQLIRNLRPHRPACLEDSVCCVLFMERYVASPSFCIGVKQPPFMAHAWVQVGDVIVNDTKGVVEAYSEILRLDL